jgi:hypothetical protein
MSRDALLLFPRSLPDCLREYLPARLSAQQFACVCVCVCVCVCCTGSP